MRTISQHKNTVAILVILLIGLFVWTLTAGDLDPPGAPGPTMKTLDEVEPRIAINPQNTPGDTSYEYIISSSGSYYLTGNLSTTKTAIYVSADHVTIDLMGFEVSGPGTGTNYGIYMSTRDDVEIRNGTVRRFYTGIYESSSYGQNHRVLNVRVVSKLRHGIYLYGENCMVRDCTVSNNGISATADIYGIYVGSCGQVTDNTVYNNGGSCSGDVYGIYGDYICTVAGNTALKNGVGATGNYVYSIAASIGSTIADNTVGFNGTQAICNYIFGIHGGSYSTITGNAVSNVGNYAEGVVDGIYAGQGSTVTNNSSSANGLSAAGTVRGIYLIGNCLVNNNTAYNNNGTNIYDIGGTCTFGINHAP